MSLQSKVPQVGLETKELDLDGVDYGKPATRLQDTFVSAFINESDTFNFCKVESKAEASIKKIDGHDFNLVHFQKIIKESGDKRLNLISCKTAAFHPSFVSYVSKKIKQTTNILRRNFSCKVINAIFTRLNHYFNIVSLALRPFENRLIRVKILQRSSSLIVEREKFKDKLIEYLSLITSDEYKKLISDNKLSLSSPLKKQLKHQIKLREFNASADALNEMAAKIISEEKSINYDYHKYLLGIVRKIFSNLALITTYSPFKILIDVAFLVGKIPGLIEFIDFIAVLISSKQSTENCRTFEIWRQNFSDKNLNPLNLLKATAVNHQNNSLGILNFDQFKHEDTTWEDIIDHFKKDSDLAEEIARRFGSHDYSVKTNAIKMSKIMRLVQSDKINPEKIDSVVRDHFAKLANKPSSQCKDTLTNRSKFLLLNEYIDHQITIENRTERALVRLLNSKLSLENIFFKFKSTQSNFSFWYSASLLSVSLAGAIMGMVFGPIGAVTGSVIAFYIASIVITLSFSIASHMLSSKYRSQTPGIFSKNFWKLIFMQVKYDINNYWLNVKKSELIKKKPALLSLIKRLPINTQEVTQREVKALIDSDLNQKCQRLRASVEKLKKEKREREIIDFKKFSKLPDDCFKHLIDSLSNLNFELIEESTKRLLKTNLGFDLDSVKQALESSDPALRKQAMNTLEKDLQTHFTLNEEGYVQFIKYQNLNKIKQI